MTDELLTYYNRELAYLRKMGAEFAAAHPKVAGRLRISADTVEDPHVSRLLEGFAYLSARLRRKIDDDFPEITQALLDVLYPHYLKPFPSVAVAQFMLDRNQVEMVDGYPIPRQTKIETEPVDGEPCRFRTCYPVTAWPLHVVSASYHTDPLPAPRIRLDGHPRALIRLEVECSQSDVPLRSFNLSSLRFFLNAPAHYVYRLYETLLNDALGVAVAPAEKAEDPAVLPAAALRAVGFERDEGLVDYSPRSFLGYRLLSEFFVFPQKFLFVDLCNLEKAVKHHLGDSSRACIFIYLDRHLPDLEPIVERDSFLLGCAPIVNLYQKRAEPIQLSQTVSEYRVLPDARRPLAHEVYSVDEVTATTPSNEEIRYAPFYSARSRVEQLGQQRFWHATRRNTQKAGGHRDAASEVYLNLVDLHFDPVGEPAGGTLDVETTCLSRNLPAKLPFGGDQPQLFLVDGGPIEKVRCVTAPTRTRRPNLKQGTHWRLISHLSLNHISLADASEGVVGLREMLRLYDFMDSEQSQSIIEGLLDVEASRVVGRVPGGVSGGFCRGLRLRLHFDEEKFSGSGVYLFASVLERFVGLYSSLNSFTRVVATTEQRDHVLREWPPRAGEMVLV